MEATRQAHGAGPVADVALHLTLDRRHGEGHELLAPLRVEALDRVQEADRTGLDEVIVLRAAPVVPAGQRIHERHVQLHQALARSRVTLLAIRAEQSARGAVALATSLRSLWHHPVGDGVLR